MQGPRIHVAARSDVGRVRKVNQDAFTVTDLDTDRRLEPSLDSVEFGVGSRGLLLVLSDGMGGHAAGEVASALVVDALRQALASGTEAEPIERRITAAVDGANADVAEASTVEGRRG